MGEKVNGLNKQINDDKSLIESIKKRADEAEEEAKVKANEIKDALSAAKKEEQSIDECTSAIIALEEECARLKKKWEELKVERQVRVEEQSKLRSIEGFGKERSLLEENLKDLENEMKAREEDEEKYVMELKFLQKQLDAVKLRFIEPKDP